MGESIGQEVGTELTVEHVQDVTVELGGNPGRIVVGRHQSSPVLDEVSAEQEPVARLHDGHEPNEEASPLLGVEVPDRPPKKGDESLPLGVELLHVVVEVPHNGPDSETGVVLGE